MSKKIILKHLETLKIIDVELTDFQKKMDEILDILREKFSESFDKKKMRKLICNHICVNKNCFSLDILQTYKNTYTEIKSIIKKQNSEKIQQEGLFVKSKKHKQVYHPFLGKLDISCSSEEKHSVRTETTILNNIKKYSYPNENFIELLSEKDTPIKLTQTNDTLTDIENKRGEIFDTLSKVITPEQCTPGWFELRGKCISASDGGAVAGVNKHEPQYKIYEKKLLNPPFPPNPDCYNGKKYETPAKMLYEVEMNVRVNEFGLMVHPKYSFLGASPDGIVSHHKYDGKHKTNLVGRMLEIKCPTRRVIKTSGPIYDHRCPAYYFAQIQLQLECCDLDECDFWQCKITEYKSREDFIDDTDGNVPFRSKSFGMAKGCVIQLLPISKVSTYIESDGKINYDKYNDVVWDKSKFIYPDKIEMSPYEIDIWISEQIANLRKNNPYYVFDKVFYWRVEVADRCLILRDRDWFEANLPTFKKTWDNILYLRKNADKAKLLFDYINSLNIKRIKPILEVVDQICNEPPSDADKKLISKYNLNIIKIQKIVDDYLKEQNEVK